MSDYLLAAGVTAMMAAVILIIVALLSRKFNLFGKWATNLTLRSSLQHENYHRMLTYWTQSTGQLKHNIIYHNASVSADRFINLLKESFQNLEVVSQICDIGGLNCNAIIKIITQSGNTILISTNWGDTEFFDSKKRKKYSAELFNVEDYLVDNNILLTHSIEICSALNEEHADIQQILNMYEISEIEYVRYEVKGVNTRIVKLIKTLMGYTTRPQNRVIVKETDQYLDIAYNKAKIRYGAEEVELSMSRAINYARKALVLGENLYIYGAKGSGKTELAQQLLARLADDDNLDNECNIVEITPGILKELQTAEGMGAFEAHLREFAIEGRRTIIFIDEAEKMMAQDGGVHTDDNSLLLQMLSGTLKKDLNCSCILIFNADPRHLNDALFRSGRLGSMTIELGALSAEQANKLVELLQEKLIDKVFDMEKYRHTLYNINQYITGTVYAGAGQIMLCDVYDAFMNRDQRALLVDCLREEAGKEPLLRKKVATPEVTKTINDNFKVEVNEQQLERRGRRPVANPAADTAPATPAPVSSAAPSIERHRKRNRKRRR